jgi:UDP-N-acetylmuramate--alanine ligase
MQKKKVHFIGIGGAGMSALARYFLSQKWAVSGSDITESPILAMLRKEGVKVKIGHNKSHITADIALVVHSQAIRQDNPELEAARQFGIKEISYPEAIGELTQKYKTIAVSGAHGKSTTTALIALILEKGGLDPTVIVGANLKEFSGKNFRSGNGDCLVLEADEFGRAFLHYSPTCAVITNIDREHLDIYKNLTDIKNTFMRFLGNIHEGGTVIINRDDKNCFSLKKKIAGLAHRKKLNVIWYSLRDPSAKKIQKIIQIPGKHNVSNALAAYYLGRTLKISEKNILAAIDAYRGANRRMEFRGTMKNASGEMLVYDDYAHHPTEIKATLRALREKFPKAEIVCAFQPHQAKRLAALFKEFQSAFDDADSALILPLYKVPGRDEESPIYNSEALVHAIQKRRPRQLVFYLNDPKNLKNALNTILSSRNMKDFCSLKYSSRAEAKSNVKKNHNTQTVLVMMGAGDIVQWTEELLKRSD